ncbi:MAG: GNAT family N-acetyltransferase [Clostridiales bacterium]|nr:GNAT family N-acetyltransferase [Clostridiales bacterium]
MVADEIRSERLIFKNFSELSEEEKQIIAKSWGNPINSRYNGSSEAPIDQVNDIASYSLPTEWGMFYKYVVLQETGEVVGTCRFGKWYKSDSASVWDFGFNVLLKYWFKGYGTEIVKTIVEVAKSEGIEKVISAADIENFGSYKSMFKNGMKFKGYDKDEDYEFEIDLTKEQIVQSQEALDQEWQSILEKAEKDLGKKRYKLIMDDFKNIRKLVTKIQDGGDEDKLIKEYLAELGEAKSLKLRG